MSVIAINASPRKNGNTAQLLRHALRGAAQNIAETKLVHLYDLDYKGCISCFACKRKGNSCNGVCAVQDDLNAVLKEIMTCDALILGSPIYLENVTGAMRSFLERLIYPNLSYNPGNPSLFEGSLPSAFIYTMNVTQAQMQQLGYTAIFEKNRVRLALFNADSEYLACTDTWQFGNYKLYEAGKFDAAHKAGVRAEQFPRDCENAFALGARLTDR